MTAINSGIGRQRHESLERALKLRRIPARKVGSSYRPPEERVAGKQCTLQMETYAPRGMTGGMQHFNRIAAEDDLVSLHDQPIRVRKILLCKAP